MYMFELHLPILVIQNTSLGTVTIILRSMDKISFKNTWFKSLSCNEYNEYFTL